MSKTTYGNFSLSTSVSSSPLQAKQHLKFVRHSQTVSAVGDGPFTLNLNIPDGCFILSGSLSGSGLTDSVTDVYTLTQIGGGNFASLGAADESALPVFSADAAYSVVSKDESFEIVKTVSTSETAGTVTATFYVAVPQ